MNFLAKIYIYLSLVVGIIACVVAIGFFSWLVVAGVAAAYDWLASSKRKLATVTAVR